MIIDGVDLPIAPLEPDELQVLEPLTTHLAALLAADDAERPIIAVAGLPGAGKSVFAARLAAHLRAVSGRPDEAIVIVPMDGYHLSNQELTRSRYEGDRYPVPHGTSLLTIKGAPETFAPAALCRDLRHCQAHAASHTLPHYDRRRHEPVAGQLAVTAETGMIVVEGNYLLLREGPWAQLDGLFQLRLYLQAPWRECLQNLRHRHHRGGRAEPWVSEHIESVDMPNMALIQPTAQAADMVVEQSGNRVIGLADER